VNDGRQDDSDDREHHVVKDRIEDDVKCHRIGHHRGFPENADQTGAKDIGRVKRVRGNYVDDGEPDRNCGCSDDSGVNSFTNGIVLLSHRSSSSVVLLA
jgi:energy-converting hydrogenase Eha subunit B